MKKLDHFLNILIGAFVGIFVGRGIYVCWALKHRPDLYVARSVPWYTSILLCGAVALTVVLAAIAVKVIIKNDAKRMQLYTEDPLMENRILKNKYFLYLTEFFSGMSVMAVELGASRLMAPYFSSSQIVWTVIIGVIMIAMAIGNLWGGRMADKSKSPDRLYGRLIIAAIWIALIPFVGRWVIAGITVLLALFVTSNFLVWAALAACLIIFAFPCVLLGTVTPSLTRFTVDNLDDTGKTVGRLNALNTIGSIIGTFLPTFVTIPSVGTAATFLIFAAVLAILSLVYFIAGHKRSIKGIGAIVLVIGLCFALPSYSFAFWQDDIALEDESIYNYLQVTDDESQTVLSTNVLFGVQSIQIKSDGLTGMYYDYALAAPLMAGLSESDSTDTSIMILGMGSGTYASYCTRYFPDTEIQGAEIDEKIVDIASKYFDLPDSVEVAVADGRAYLTASDELFDVIMVDAYQDITIPFQLSSVEFFTEVSEHLKEGGVMVVNLNMVTDEPGSINDYLCDTMASVFSYVYTVDVPGNTNREVFCTDNADALAVFESCRADLNEEDLAAAMEQVSASLTVYEAGDLILTDDKAPVELLGMRVLDELIVDELSYYKQLLQNGELSLDLLLG